MTKLMIALGTRPEIIKLSPIIQECERRDVDYTLLHTGQHYSDSLDSVFFEQLELPVPDFNLEVGSKSQGKQTAEMLSGIEEILLEEGPDILVVQGDTNSVLAGSIAASKVNTEIAHVEAGLRSFDRQMPEEINRVLTDHVGDYLFPPTEQSKSHLVNEGISEDRITVSGNTIVDALERNRKFAAAKSSIISELDVVEDEFFLMTAHRAENVDDKDRLENLLIGVDNAARVYGYEVIYPIHPRANSKIEEFGLAVPDSIHLIEPLDYLDFLRVETAARLILTDSGGVQEEACVLGIPCVTMRDSTERPETISVGANQLSGIHPKEITKVVGEMLNRDSDWENPFGDGKSAKKIVDILL